MENHQEPSDLKYVGFWLRLWATIIDLIILMLIITPVLYIVYGRAYFESKAIIKGPVDFIVQIVFPAVAVIFFWKYRSATPGKMVISARIVDAGTGGPPSTGQLIGRYFAYLVSTIPFCIGFLWIAFNKHKQAWHDKLARTVVVRPAKSGTGSVIFDQPTDNAEKEI